MNIRYARPLLALVFLLIALPSGARAQSLTGSWQLEAEGPRGVQTITLQLVHEGGELTGTAEMAMRGRPGGGGGGGGGRPAGGGRMMEMEVTDGSVDGNRFTFLLVRAFNGNTIETQYSGTFEGNEMTGTISGGRGGERPFTGTRQEG